ncbi:hypothetical protein [Nocardia niigatensis]
MPRVAVPTFDRAENQQKDHEGRIRLGLKGFAKLLLLDDRSDPFRVSLKSVIVEFGL